PLPLLHCCPCCVVVRCAQVRNVVEPDTKRRGGDLVNCWRGARRGTVGGHGRGLREPPGRESNSPLMLLPGIYGAVGERPGCSPWDAGDGAVSVERQRTPL